MWKVWLCDSELGKGRPYQYNELSDIPIKGITRKVYDYFISDDMLILKYLCRWKEIGFDFDTDHYKMAFRYIYRCSKITKYQDFQYRLLLGKIVTNDDLFTWGKIDSPHCTFCNLERETIQHLFYTCKYVEPLLE